MGKCVALAAMGTDAPRLRALYGAEVEELEDSSSKRKVYLPN